MKKLSVVLALSAFVFSAGAVAASVEQTARSTVIKTEQLPNGAGVQTTVVGKGKVPSPTSSVTVHYKGTLENGKVFDSSYVRGVPATFSLNGVIPCWTEGLQKMKEGGKAKLICPSNTAYGERGAAGVVPPNATLYFDVELLKVND